MAGIVTYHLKICLDINHITKKVTYNLQNSLQSSIEITEKNTDVDASKYNNLSLSVGNLGGNERKKLGFDFK